MTGPERSEGEQRSDAAVDTGLGLVIAALAAVALFWLIPAQVSTKATGTDVAPAFIPQLSAWIILILALALVGHRWLRENPAGGWRRGRQLVIEFVALAVAAAAVVLAIITVGFIPMAVLMILGGGILARHKPFWAVCILAILVPLVIDYAAWEIFVVDLP